MKFFTLSIIFSLAFGLNSFAQLSKNTQVPDSFSYRKNAIRIEATSILLYHNAFVFSFERMIKKNQSIVLTAGYQELSGISSFSDSIKVIHKNSNKGYKLGAEYRFYLAKENKYASPHGLYFGPYFSALGFNNATDIQVKANGTLQGATLNSDIHIYNFGVEFGYQFALSNRWNIDMIFAGPSISSYDIRSKLGGNFTFDPGQIQNVIFQKLIERFPGMKDLLSGETVGSSGELNKWGVGFRYQVNIAYRFGRKK
jgi:Protein of unknown function (DUF3575)